jgi:hypothetical protein
MAAPWRTDGAVELYVDASPAAVYDRVADVTRTRERSSECHTCEWLPGEEPGTVGSRFRGRNRFKLARWSRVCEVVAAEPGRTFAYRTVPERLDPSRADSTLWSYELEPQGEGTLVRHRYEIRKLPVQPFRWFYGSYLAHHRDMRPQMQETLEALRGELTRQAA